VCCSHRPTAAGESKAGPDDEHGQTGPEKRSRDIISSQLTQKLFQVVTYIHKVSLSLSLSLSLSYKISACVCRDSLYFANVLSNPKTVLSMSSHCTAMLNRYQVY
jgi:hypothetical protein